MMKKSLLAFLAVSLLSSIYANDFDTKVYVGATSGKLDGERYNQFGVGYTANTKFDNDILLGFGNSVYYGEVTSNRSATTVDLDLRVGYELLRDLTAYAIGTGVYQYYDNSSATGLGYGGSLEYKFTRNFALEGTYKTVDMEHNSHKYDYDTTNLAVKFSY
ncbi:outer membrane beta-barrel protein [Aliarcobacter butzleri]|uniref:outer membrane beta-barrel protein n=2 Tax=Aliarcobacter butzleri TaxID=28197 RepID=UPI00063ADDF0|nr:outer membrane beta-barrel protein [Aliarcobacter butzleri]KLE10146.1 hypothetical protein AF79_04110 [Aliarcobacter butzleri L354]MCG3694642.1 outer membrane beta-barrel protein [Aliarcobacter butzleri]MCT7557433.1 outer membrane beta-barrel protein [Aliarcobacter butzleri]MCT7564495.1 outer membrane beta-barrel protein [Aliarcobacter butzleri]MCT7572698.1 outer membrane beta-barrel protein [Aliarcobacter butzleri]